MLREVLKRIMIVVGSLWLFPASADATMILETSLYGGVRPLGGMYVDGEQFCGARFHLGGPAIIDHIGGNFGRYGDSGNNMIFGAIMALSSTGYPAGDLHNLAPLAATTFQLQLGAEDILVPLSASLQPGDYALVFGSGLFGADCSTAYLNEGNNIPNGQQSFFAIDTNPGGTAWHNVGNGGMTHDRFVVTGTVSEFPEPSATTLLLAGALGLLAYAWRRRR